MRTGVIVIATVGLLAAAGFGAFSLFPDAGHSDARCGPGLYGPTGVTGTNGGFMMPAPRIDIRAHRSGAKLDSVTVTVAPRQANRDIEVDVLHRASACSTRYSAVYRSRFSRTNPPSAWVGSTRGIAAFFRHSSNVGSRPTAPPPDLSTWTGTLHPRDWTGGCRSGLYWIAVVWPSVEPNRMDGYFADTFRCR